MSAREALAARRVMLLDGGTGSELRRRGLILSDVCWSASVNLEHGALLEAIHRDYIAAGADIVTANTFGTSRFVLEEAGLGERFETVNRAALRAARAAADSVKDRDVLVAASMSCMPPRFDPGARPPPEGEYRAYAELAGLFASEGVDLVLLEMLQAPAQVERSCRAVQATGLPFMAGLSCRLSARATGANGARRARERLVSFDDPDVAFEPVLDAALAYAPDAIAIMHSPIDAMLPALELLRTRWRGPMGAYAEIPYPEDPEGHGAARPAPDAYAAAAQSWVSAGARIVGGCCGTTPAHIAAVSVQVIDR